MNIRPFLPHDAPAVRELFIRINRLLAPAAMKEAVEGYIARSLSEEIDRIIDYYAQRNGGFWVSEDGRRIVGMFGLEASGDGAMESRRMYVDPDMRRRGIARRMVDFAERECRRHKRFRMELSTSEIQAEALAPLSERRLRTCPRRDCGSRQQQDSRRWHSPLSFHEGALIRLRGSIRP